MKVSRKAVVTSCRLEHFLSGKLLCLPPGFPSFEKYLIIVEKSFFYFFISEEESFWFSG